MPRYAAVLSVIFALALFSGSAQAQGPTSFTYTTVDVSAAEPGGTRVNGINARGDIVGRYRDSGGTAHGFLLAVDGTFTSFDVSGACATSARAINARGEIAGRYRDCSTSRTSHGFFRAADGTITTFDVPSTFGADGTAAFGINDRDEIVGAYTLSTSIGTTTVDVPHGFLRKADGTFTKIDFPNADATVAAAIDDQGDIVGGYFLLLSTNPISVGVHGFLETSQGAFSTIDAQFSGAVATFLVGINEPGDIVGSYSTNAFEATNLDLHKAPESGNHGFLRTKDGSFVELDASPAGVSVIGTFGKKINPRGNFVGTYTDSSGLEHGYLATRQTP